MCLFWACLCSMLLCHVMRTLNKLTELFSLRCCSPSQFCNAAATCCAFTHCKLQGQELPCASLQGRVQGGRSTQGAEGSKWLPLERIALRFLPQPFASPHSTVAMTVIFSNMTGPPISFYCLVPTKFGRIFLEKSLSSQFLYCLLCAAGRKWGGWRKERSESKTHPTFLNIL